MIEIEATTFDYAELDTESRIVVQQRTTEIKGLIEGIQRNTIEIGRRLRDVKAKLTHGWWGRWLEAETPFSRDTADRLIQTADLADRFPQIAANRDFLPRSTLYLLAAPNADQAVVDAIVTEVEAGAKLTTPEIKERLSPKPIFDDAAFVDAQRRFASLGWKLVRHGVWYKLSKPDGTHYATTQDLAPQIATLETLEQHIVGQRTDPNKADPKEPPAATPIDDLTRSMATALESEFGIPVEIVECQQPQAPALPPLPADLARDWTRWRNDDGVIGMQHASGYKLSGSDPAVLESLARAYRRALAELGDHGWRVYYDAGADGRTDLHAYTATHDEFEHIAAHDLNALALRAWRARLYEDELPAMPDDVIDGLWLSGFDWSGTAFSRGFEKVDESTPLGELRYLAGLETKATTPERMLPPDFAEAQKRAKAIGLWIDAKASGAYGLHEEATNDPAGGAVDWPALLDLLARKELAGPTKAAPHHGWWNVGVELSAIQKAINASDQQGAIRATLTLLHAFTADQPTPAPIARAFVDGRREDMAHWSKSAMASQSDMRTALDHIDTLIRFIERGNA